MPTILPNTAVTIFPDDVQAPRFIGTSDERLKTNIKSYKPKGSILDIDVKEFDYKSDGSHHIGCLAQDLKEVAPELVLEDGKGYMAVEDNKVVYLLLQEVKKLKAEIEELKKGK